MKVAAITIPVTFSRLISSVDGPRIPLIIVSPYAKPGYVDHTSILKFIEANWGLAPLSPRSRDRLPNSVTDASNPYAPLNRPAIGDLMNLFDFD